MMNDDIEVTFQTDTITLDDGQQSVSADAVAFQNKRFVKAFIESNVHWSTVASPVRMIAS